VNCIKVVGLGALNIDRLYQVERILNDGEAIVERTAQLPGGSAAHTIYGLARLGVPTGFIGIVGSDAEGESLVQDFAKIGVDTSQIKVTPDAKTGSVLCLSDRQGKRSLYVSPGANNLLSVNDIDLGYLNQARILHLSSFANERQFKIALVLIERLSPSTKLSFSPGALYAQRGFQALQPIISRAHVLLVNQDEICRLTGGDITAGASRCLEQGCKTVVVTLGQGMMLELGEGAGYKKVTAICYIRDAEGEYVVPPIPQDTLPQVDTTGAGDAFATGFLYGLVKEKGPIECGRLGNIVARLAISQIGARQGLPTLSQLTQRYQELYSE